MAAAPMTAAEAVAAAAEEGLALVRADNKTGHKCVAFRQGPRPYQLKISVQGHPQCLGSFATAEEAALEYARHVGKEQAAQEAEAAALPMTAAEALAAAEEEDLMLVRADSKAGFKGVTYVQGNKTGRSRPYALKIWAEGRAQRLGYYATAEEAALEYARHVGKERAAKEAAEAAPPMTAAEVLARAAEEGLMLVRADNKTRYKNVAFHHGKPRPYQLQITVDGRTQSLGNFATGEEAALHLARCRRDASIELDNIEGLEFRSQSTKHRRRLLSMRDSRRVAHHVFERSRLGGSIR
jgi:hypothetical protein